MIVIAPVLSPAAVGVKVILTAQLAPAARLLLPVGQLLVWAKSPLATMVVMVNSALPLLVSVTACGRWSCPRVGYQSPSW